LGFSTGQAYSKVASSKQKFRQTDHAHFNKGFNNQLIISLKTNTVVLGANIKKAQYNFRSLRFNLIQTGCKLYPGKLTTIYQK